MSDLLDRIEDELEQLVNLLELEGCQSANGLKLLLLAAKAIEERMPLVKSLLVKAQQAGLDVNTHLRDFDILSEFPGVICEAVDAHLKNKNEDKSEPLPEPEGVILRVFALQQDLVREKRYMQAEEQLQSGLKNELEEFHVKDAERKSRGSINGKKSAQARLDAKSKKEEKAMELANRLWDSNPQLPTGSVITKLRQDENCPYDSHKPLKPIVEKVFKGRKQISIEAPSME